MSLESLINAIRYGEVYGFAVIDITTPQEIIEKHLEDSFLFPPIIQRKKLDESFLSDFMKQRYRESQKKLDMETVIQGYHGTDIFAITTLIQFWLDQGLEITDIKHFVQYQPGKALKPFAEKVTKLRIEATFDGDEAKATSAKLAGNSGYGKCGENVLRHTNTKVVIDQKKMLKEAEKAFTLDQNEIINECDELVAWEVKQRKRQITDCKPIHFANAILQTSKLLFLEFMYYIYNHLQPGSFRTCYADTDSMCLALTKTNHAEMNGNIESFYRGLFDPIVKPSMRESWERTWKKWFVTTDDIHDIRKPGKLKGEGLIIMPSYKFLVEFDFKKGQFVALSSKCYFSWNDENQSSKIGSKGVPRSSKLELQNFLDKLYHNTSISANIHTLKMHNHEMIRCLQRRSALNDLFPKFHMDSDRITCTPLRHNNQIV